MSKSLIVSQPREITRDQDVLQIVQDWRAALDLQVEAGEISDQTSATYRRGWQKFMDWCISAGVQTVDAETIRRWKADLVKRQYKPATINAWLAGVRAFFAWAVGNRRLAYNPTEGVRSAKRKDSKKHKRDALTNTEARRLIAAPDTTTVIGKRDKAIITTMLYTAVRGIEIRRAQLADLRTVKNRLVLDVTGKGSSEADDYVVLANQAAVDAMYDWLAVRGSQPGALFISLSDRSRGKPLSAPALRAIIKAYMHKVGITNGRKTTHSLRHTATTSAIEHDATPLQAKGMTRHKSLDMVLNYFHENARLEKPAEDLIDYGEG